MMKLIICRRTLRNFAGLTNTGLFLTAQVTNRIAVSVSHSAELCIVTHDRNCLLSDEYICRPVMVD